MNQLYRGINYFSEDEGNIFEYTKSIKDGNGPITLVIDEANIAVTIKGKATDNRIADVENVFSLFTRLTKQLNMLNVNLISSEHSFPFPMIIEYMI